MKVHYLLKKEINELYLMNAIRTFALSTIAIFVPIFLLTKGYLLEDVALFFLVKAIAGVVCCYGALKFAARYGVKHSLLMSIPLMTAFFLALYNIDVFRDLIGNYTTLISFGALEALASADLFN